MRKKQKSITQLGLERFFHINQKPKKSKFQQRLEDVQRQQKETQRLQEVTQRQQETTQEIQEGTQLQQEKTQRLLKKNMETQTSGDPMSLQTQLAQRPSDEWISVNLNKPPYYTPVDVLDINMNVWEDWHRLSDGDKDYYCNPRTDHLTQNVTHWRKRPGITYEPYNPMTTNDIPIMNINELNDMIKVMIKLIDKRTSSHLPHIEYVTGVDDAIIAVEQTFKQILKAKRMTGK